MLARHGIHISPTLVIEELVEIREADYDPLVIRRVMEARSAAYWRRRHETPAAQLHKALARLEDAIAAPSGRVGTNGAG